MICKKKKRKNTLNRSSPYYIACFLCSFTVKVLGITIAPAVISILLSSSQARPQLHKHGNIVTQNEAETKMVKVKNGTFMHTSGSN